MILAASIRRKQLHRFRSSKTRHGEPAGPTAPHRARIPFPSTQAGRAQSVLTVDLASPDGRTWRAVGGGDTLGEALAFARDSCPTGTTWQPVSWKHVYGD